MPLQMLLEILEMIVAPLDHRADINALARTSRELHRQLNPYLYRPSADYVQSFNLLWAARVG
ncbi:uncharacterized protein BO72DRAFT_450007 [Aspergillus fijiensis CBS 313.89]|uniref:Uncharacterized protein n=1 Tax=Aspergillus fijiensis CBS 313.89 TaxID=1448319 RepID=A0A8G1RR90_9EURO|nr:uncharacterized protein BO72DRAFT_450007 [Aspergillus fijiensis CBS 313.89]RAK75246.1 hypothetical protein BO72DRAFT_450007 [Aspergillus fijiensis CBS 313.89]